MSHPIGGQRAGAPQASEGSAVANRVAAWPGQVSPGGVLCWASPGGIAGIGEFAVLVPDHADLAEGEAGEQADDVELDQLVDIGVKSLISATANAASNTMPLETPAGHPGGAAGGAGNGPGPGWRPASGSC